MRDPPDRTSSYQADSLSFVGAGALCTGVMIGAGIFASGMNVFFETIGWLSRRWLLKPADRIEARTNETA